MTMNKMTSKWLPNFTKYKKIKTMKIKQIKSVQMRRLAALSIQLKTKKIHKILNKLKNKKYNFRMIKRSSKPKNKRKMLKKRQRMLRKKNRSRNRWQCLHLELLVLKKVQRAGKNLLTRVREVRGLVDVTKRSRRLSRKLSRKKRFLTKSNQRSFRPTLAKGRSEAKNLLQRKTINILQIKLTQFPSLQLADQEEINSNNPNLNLNCLQNKPGRVENLPEAKSLNKLRRFRSMKKSQSKTILKL